MNCPSRNEEPLEHEGWNQNPSALAADLTTREDLNGTVNRRTNQDFGDQDEDARTEEGQEGNSVDYHRLPNRNDEQSPKNLGGNDNPLRLLDPKAEESSGPQRRRSRSSRRYESFPALEPTDTPNTAASIRESPSRRGGHQRKMLQSARDAGRIFTKFLGFVGPGFMVAVAYMDPGNYSTDVAAGVATKFQLLFIVLMSNVFAIVLQSLAIRLGTVTGLNLAQHCRAHLPRWLNLMLYILGEVAIIATDIAEVSIS